MKRRTGLLLGIISSITIRKLSVGDILRLLLASWTGIRGIGFILNRKLCVLFQARNLPFVSLKLLTSTENNLHQLQAGPEFCIAVVVKRTESD